MGQLGWDAFYDPRYSLAFLNTGDPTISTPTFVRKNSFHDNYNVAFGAFGSNYMDITDNVIYRTVGTSEYSIIHIQYRNLPYKGPL